MSRVVLLVIVGVFLYVMLWISSFIWCITQALDGIGLGINIPYLVILVDTSFVFLTCIYVMDNLRGS